MNSVLWIVCPCPSRLLESGNVAIDFESVGIRHVGMESMIIESMIVQTLVLVELLSGKTMRTNILLFVAGRHGFVRNFLNKKRYARIRVRDRVSDLRQRRNERISWLSNLFCRAW